jgi:CrcB protein
MGRGRSELFARKRGEDLPRLWPGVNFLGDFRGFYRQAVGSRVGSGPVKWVALFLGGGIGASLRYLLAVLVDARAGSPFPWGTLSVNFLGCFTIGLLATLAEERGIGTSPTLRLFAITGVLGSFTTFSTFGLESLRLMESGRLHLAAANAFGSLAVCLVAVALGIAAARSVG